MIDKALVLANQCDMSLYFNVIEKVKEAIRLRTDLNDQFSVNIALLMSKYPDFKQEINKPKSEKLISELNSSEEVIICEIDEIDENEVNKGILFSKTWKS